MIAHDSSLISVPAPKRTSLLLVLVLSLACTQGAKATTPDPAIAATPTPTPGRLVNISARALVGTGDRVTIGGFITNTTAPKEVVLRGIGPSLNVQGVLIPGRLLDPVIQLHNSAGQLVVANDDWEDSQKTQIEGTGLQPSSRFESAILRTLDATTHTVILRGDNSGTGIGLIEIYDRFSTPDSRLTNLSARAFVGTGDNVLIAGFIVGDTGSIRLIIRALGPSLADLGVVDPLADPKLDLFDVNGAAIGMNNNWQDDQQSDLVLSRLAPTRPAEAALITTLLPGHYTAIARGHDGGSGTALLEVYDVPEPVPMQ